MQATNYAKDLNLHVRLAIPCSNSAIELSTKFGILPSQAVDLIKDVAKYSSKTGICFHVGSQCMDPIEYRKAIMIAGDLIEKNKLKIDIFDIGGGFPAKYTSMNPPSIKSYFNEIKDSLKSVNINNECEIWCEPGRSLVAESSSLLVRVEARKDNILYINDGTYGGLFDAGSLEFSFPVRGLRSKNLQEKLDDNMQDFSFYGPTCDSIDFMRGPFYLPKNIKTGDYIEIFQLGSYSKSMRSNFNGFNDFKEIIVEDRPFLSIFEHNQNKQGNEKKDLLKKEVKHIDITKFDSRNIISQMADMSFTSRDLAKACEIFNMMLKDDSCSIILTLAGSTSAGGCMNLYSDLIKYNMVDAIVATGASIADMDFFEALGFKHYQGIQFIDDKFLRQNYIDRIYDTYIDENDLQNCDHIIYEIANSLPPKAYSSCEFINHMGKYLKNNSKSGIFS